MGKIIHSFHQSVNVLLSYVPEIIGGLACFMVTLLIAGLFSRWSSGYSMMRTRDRLIATFIGRIIWAVVFIVGCVIALGIMGLGTVSNKILAGAGITTFVIGFALKDIGENFLAGLILAFSRPYREGSLIECDGIKGIVKSMTMRQTTVEAENGRIILIPNSSIIKQPLTKYDRSDMDMRQDFTLSVETDKARSAVEIISETIRDFPHVMKEEKKCIKVFVDSLHADKAKVQVIFWFDTTRLEVSRPGAKSEIILQVLDRLKSAGIQYSG